VKSDFSYQVIEITRFVQGALDQELFDQVYGKGIVKSAEEFRAKIKEDLSGQYVSDSDYKFLLDARKFLVEKVGKLDYSEPLLKRIMLMNNEDKGEAYVAENYDNGVEELTWHLIKDKLMTEANIKVEQADIREMAKEITRAQFARYGMMTVPDDVLENYSQEMLTKKESVDNLVSRVLEVKLAASLKEKVKLTKKPVSIEKFNKMFE
jgi:trigger factor